MDWILYNIIISSSYKKDVDKFWNTLYLIIVTTRETMIQLTCLLGVSPFPRVALVPCQYDGTRAEQRRRGIESARAARRPDHRRRRKWRRRTYLDHPEIKLHYITHPLR